VHEEQLSKMVGMAVCVIKACLSRLCIDPRTWPLMVNTMQPLLLLRMDMASPVITPLLMETTEQHSLRSSCL
jgi:hypothetical protein